MGAGVPLVFLDTETTGLHPGADPWEVAMIRRDPDGTERTRCFFVEVLTAHADPYALNVGRYYERHPNATRWQPEQGKTHIVTSIQLKKERGAAPPVAAKPVPGPRPVVMSQHKAAQEVATWTHRAWVVGSNPAFDTTVLGRMLRRQGIAPTWDYHLIDVAALAAGWLNAGEEPLAPPWKSYDLSRACGVEPPGEGEAHTALGDALWVRRLYDAITGPVSDA